MSWHVEHGRARGVLRELPAGCAQTCLFSPAPRAPRHVVLGALNEAYRVMRDDGTVWLLQDPQPLAGELVEQGWFAQRIAWAARLTRGGVQLTLLTKTTGYFYDTTPVSDPRRLRVLPGRQRPAPVEECPWVAEYERRLRLSKLCVLAGSSPVACGVCGAPWRRVHPGGPGRGVRGPLCGHGDAGGRCLVLDPFCRHPEIGRVAARYGRSFLGVADPREREWV